MDVTQEELVTGIMITVIVFVSWFVIYQMIRMVGEEIKMHVDKQIRDLKADLRAELEGSEERRAARIKCDMHTAEIEIKGAIQTAKNEITSNLSRYR